MLNWKRVGVIASLILIAIYPLLSRAPYTMHLFNLFFLWSVVAANWNLLMGYAGIWSMGNLAFMVIGSYTSALLTMNFGWPTFPCILLGGLASMLSVTIFIGLPCLRLSGIYIALLSLMFSSTLPTLATQTRSVTGGAAGLENVPPLFEGITRIHWYYINFGLFLVMLTIIYKTIHSSNGLAFIAMRDSKELATSLGVNEYKEKLKVFALTSFLTGITGGFYVHYLGAITPSILGVEQFLMTIAMMEIGGFGHFPGGVLGALFIVFGSEYLRLVGTLRFTLLGGLICAIILFFPGGLMEFIGRLETGITRFRQRGAVSPARTSGSR